MKLDYIDIGVAERKTDCYDGDECDKLKPYWNCYMDGDMQDEDVDGDIDFSPNNFPPGTKIIISVPICPCCCESKQTRSSDICEFDWEEWELNEYS